MDIKKAIALGLARAAGTTALTEIVTVDGTYRTTDGFCVQVGWNNGMTHSSPELHPALASAHEAAKETAESRYGDHGDDENDKNWAKLYHAIMTKGGFADVL